MICYDGRIPIAMSAPRIKAANKKGNVDASRRSED
jgi:hypothetical protein